MAEEAREEKLDNLYLPNHSEHLSERFKNRLKRQREAMIDSPERNPCFNEGQMALQCKYTHVNNKECEPYYQNVKLCRAFWAKIVKIRKREGIDPALPPVDEREKVMEEYKELLGS